MDKQFILDTALFLRKMGYDVIPNHPTRKYPVGFEGWQTRQFTDEELSDKILGEGWGIGIRNLEGLDVDNKLGTAGELYKNWRELVDSLTPGLVDRLTIETTQSGGYHVFWKCPTIEGNQKLAMADKITLIETRGAGGQFMVSPSPGYQKIQGSLPNLTTITPDEREVLLQCAKAFDAPKPERPQAAGQSANGDRPGDVYNQQHPQEALELLEAAGWARVTNHGDTLYLRRPGKSQGVSATFNYAGSGLFYPFTSNGAPFEPETSYSPFAIYTTLKHGGDWTAATKDLAQRFGLNGNGKTDKTSVLNLSEDTEPRQPVFTRLSLSELLQRPKKQWLIDNVIGKNDLAMIYGDPGSGKSLIAIQMMIDAATGSTFADRFSVPEPLRVVYCAGEGLAGLPGRFAAVINKHGLKPQDVTITTFADVPQLFDAESQQNIFTFINELSGQTVDLLVIDTLHAASVGGDENSAKDTGVILQAAKFARDTLNCTVLLVHHANKSGGYRGSSALHGAMDTMLLTKADDDGYGWLECFKLKDGEKFKRIPFRITPEAVSESAYISWGETTELNDEPTPREKARAAVVDLLAETPGLNQSAIVNALANIANRKTIIKALDELETRGEIQTKTAAKNSKEYTLSV